MGSLRVGSLACCSLIAGSFLSGSGIAGAASADATKSAPARVLVVTLPGATWKELDSGVAPTITRDAKSGLIANLSMRTYVPKPSAADAAATFSAGTRAKGGLFGGQGLGVEEESQGVSASTLYEERFGERPRNADVVNLAAPRIIRGNAGDLYKAEVGRLGSILENHRIRTGVIANADRDNDPEIRDRSATLALMTDRGTLPCGAVGRDLLTNDRRAAFGMRYDVPRVVRAIKDCVGSPGRSSVTLFDAADLTRANAYESVSTESAAVLQRQLAWRTTDQIVADVLNDTKPDVVIYLGWSASGTRTLGVFSLVRRGAPGGTAVSGTTRQDGIVAATDLAPNILDLFGLPLDESMDGRPIERADDAAASVHDLIEVNDTATWFDEVGASARLLFAAFAALVLGLGVLVALGRGSVRGLRVASFSLLMMLPLSTAMMVIPVASLGSVGSLAALVGAALGCGWALSLLSNRYGTLIALGAVMVVPAVSVILFSSTWQVSSIFGNSPVTAGRFSGLNNTAFAFVLASVLGIATIWRRAVGPNADFGIAAMFAAVLVVQGAPMWGSDVGGILAGVPILVLAWLVLTSRRLRFTRVALAGMITVAIVGIAIAIDLHRPTADQTHLGRFWQRSRSDGIDGFLTVIDRKLTMNIRALAWGPGWIVTIIALSAAILWWTQRDRIGSLPIDTTYSTKYLVVLGIAVLIATALNDSGIAIPAGIGLVTIGTLGSLGLPPKASSYTVANTHDED
ncbi:MAG: hypothetical protein WBD02_02765 [Acidimicrobiia bacterium]